MVKNKRKYNDILTTVLVIVIVIIINVIAQFIYTKIDLTEDKRYSLSPSTIRTIESVEEPMFIRVLLEGEFPIGFQRLQTSTKEILNEIHHLNPLINYEFYNPNEGEVAEVNERKVQWSKDGINPVNFRMNSNEERVEKLIYPFAIVSYNNKKNHINLLEEQLPGMGQDLALNNSINLLEYKFTQIIDYIQMNEKPAVVFTEGQGELSNQNIASMYEELRTFYRVGRLNLDSIYVIPQEISALVVAKPRYPFSEQKKFMIDQYIMNGGKVLWLIDQLDVKQDSVQAKKFYFPRPYDLNLDDLFFKYGFRINSDLVMDMESTDIPLVIGESGGQVQMDMFRWYFHLLITPNLNSIITKSLNPINLFYASSIDTIKTKSKVEKTVLMSSSDKSKFQMSPVRMSLDMLRIPPQELNFKSENIPVSILLEGSFNSLYENRVTSNMLQGLDRLDLEFKKSIADNRMIVVSDGDIISNNYRPDTEEYTPTGYNPYTNAVYANKDFILNAIEYLIDSDGILSARNKSIKMRLLNREKIRKEKTYWQILNVGVPILGLILFGFAYTFYRKRKYA